MEADLAALKITDQNTHQVAPSCAQARQAGIQSNPPSNVETTEAQVSLLTISTLPLYNALISPVLGKTADGYSALAARNVGNFLHYFRVLTSSSKHITGVIADQVMCRQEPGPAEHQGQRRNSTPGALIPHHTESLTEAGSLSIEPGAEQPRRHSSGQIHHVMQQWRQANPRDEPFNSVTYYGRQNSAGNQQSTM